MRLSRRQRFPLKRSCFHFRPRAVPYDARWYLGGELLAFMGAKPNATLSALVGSIAAKLARSFQSASEAEFVATIARLYEADMCALFAEAAVDVVGLFA